MEMHIGTPSKAYSAIFDSGSDILWLQTDTCKECTGFNDYVVGNSTSFEKISDSRF